MSVQTTPLLWDWGGPSQGRGGGGVESVSPLLRDSVTKLRRGAPPFWSSFTVSPLVHPPSPSGRGYPERERVWLSPSPPSDYKISIKPVFSWNASWARKHMGWPKDTTIIGSSWLWNMRGSKQRWPKRQMSLLKKSFLWWAQHWIKLLPWCVSSTVPFHYMSKALDTAMQQDKDVSTTTTTPQLKGSPTLGLSSSPACPTETLPPLVPLLPDVPFVATPPVGHTFPGFIASPTSKSGTALPAVHSMIIITRGP